MNPLVLADLYMDCVYGNKTIDTLKDILHPELHFCGPFFECHGAEQYLKAMADAPSSGFHCEILERYVQDNSACLIYKFSKPKVETMMAQTFRVDSGKITAIRLIFDSAAFHLQ